MATVGRVSNIEHHNVKLTCHQENRELGMKSDFVHDTLIKLNLIEIYFFLIGNRPRSGLWQRKTGRFGRKIKPIPPMRYMSGLPPPPPEKLVLSMDPHPEPVPIYGHCF